MKLGVIGGAGLIGATTAFFAATEHVAEEIVLYDLKDNLAVSHAMDIDIAVSEFHDIVARSGDFDDLADCDVIFNTAGIPERKVASRAEYLEGNLVIYRDIARRIRAWGSMPVIVSASNPVDVLNYVLLEEIGCTPEKLIGFSRNDSVRLQWAIARECGLSTPDVEAFVIGEHGDGQVPLFSTVRNRRAGLPLELSEVQRANILSRIGDWFTEYQKLDCGRSSGWTSGVSMTRILEMICDDSDSVVSCSVIPNGEYGLSGLSIGLPVKLGPGGVKEIVELRLEDSELAALHAAAAKIHAMTPAPQQRK